MCMWPRKKGIARFGRGQGGARLFDSCFRCRLEDELLGIAIDGLLAAP